MQALILAGGLGTRLRKITKDTPKVMVNIKERPFLEYLILQLKNYNLNDIILCTGYLKEKIESYFGNGNHLGVNIVYSEEPKPLGTGGAIKLAESLVKSDDFIVMNGDSFFDIDLDKLISYHFNKRALATIALVEVKDIRRFGIVKIDKDGKIESFFEKAKKQDSNLINGGTYLLNKEIFKFIPKDKSISLEKEIFPKLINSNRFYGVSFKNYFIDIGIPKAYKILQENPECLLKLKKYERRK
jgi:NDP-sugar pyrophosphorylase family protein